MKNLDRDSIDFGKGSIGGLFVKLLLPTLAGLLFSSIFLLTDGIFVGHGIGSDGLAVVNIVMPIFTLETGIGMMFAIGASVVAAIHLAKDNVKAARIIVTQAYIAVLFLGALLALVLYCFPGAVLRLLGASEELMPMCLEYYLWFAPCGLCVMLQLVSQFVIRLDGDPMYSGLVEIVPACFNILLDWFFIFQMKWGLMGAALATSIGSFTGVLMSLADLLFRRRTLALYRLKRTVTSLVLTLRNIGYMAKVGFSGFLAEFSMSVLTLAGNYAFMRMLGEDGVAAFSVACYLLPIVYMICCAIAQSAQPIISYNYGKGDSPRMSQAFRISTSCAVIVGAVITLLITFFCKYVVLIFLDSASPVYEMCVKGFPIFTIGFAFMAVNVNVIGYCQSVEQSARSIIFTILRGMLLPVTAFFLLPQYFGTNGLWMSLPVSEILTFIAIAATYLADSRSHKSAA